MPAAEVSGPRMAVRPVRVVLAACLVMLVICSGLALQAAWRWPLVGDSALIRYVVFLIQQGQVPYAHIVDINLPGSYLLEAMAMKCFGWDAAGLRFYDGFLCLAFCGLAYCLPGKDRWERLGGLGAGLLFLLIHLQDGLTEAGQRDLALAVLMLGGVAVLARGRRHTILAVFCFELMVGFSLTIKPTLWLMALMPLLMRFDGPNRLRSIAWKRLVAASAGLLAAPALSAVWLWRMGSLAAFIRVERSIGVLHGELGRHEWGFLLVHCTAPVTIFVVLWLVLLATRALAFDELRLLLLAAALCGLLSYLEQGKGLSYQRYPFLALALVLIGMDLVRASRLRGLAAAASLVAVGSIMLWFAPRFTGTVRSFDTTQPFEDHLAQSLRAHPGSVQCLDTFGGCINTLYEMRAVQATGYLYDCYLFSSPSLAHDAARDAYRDRFLLSFQAARPQTVVLTNQPCFDPAKNFDRMTSWPAFAQTMQEQYRLAGEWHTEKTYRWWSRWERPIAYQIYVLR